MFNTSDSITKRITSIQFGLFDPDEIRRGSVCQIMHSELMESGVPKDGGLLDLRMGTIDKQFRCKTCGCNMFECVGHFGHIELCKPMFHVGYINSVKKLLECICFYCSNLKGKIPKNIKSLDEAWELLKNKSICGRTNAKGDKIGCGCKQPIIRKEGLFLVAIMRNSTIDGEGRERLSGKSVWKIFKKIKEEDFETLGFSAKNSKPENLLLSVILVAPPSARPSVLSRGLRSEDDITYKYTDIIKSNGYLKKYEIESVPKHVANDYEQLLQYHIFTLMNNEVSGIPTSTHSSGRPLKSITCRIKGKEGRIRGCLMGKRVDFSARTVITPDSNIELDQIGFPIKLAKILTFPEKVTPFNNQKLQKCINNGPTEYPGANYVIRTDGQKIDLKYNRHDLQLEIGSIVERHLQDDDVVLFNRQPSLHKMSMMAHRIKVINSKTFTVNLSATTPYNADFDGDEMNVHVPQTYLTKAELVYLASVSRHIVSPQSNRPVIGFVQDTLLGIRLITLKDTMFTKREAMNLFFANGIDFNIKPAIMSPVELWTGKQLISELIPKINFFKALVDNDDVLVLNGILISGVLDKSNCSSGQGGLIHIIFNDFNYLEAKRFIDRMQRIIGFYMLHYNSFSVGIGDCLVDEQILNDSKKVVNKAIADVEDTITDAKKGLLENAPGLSLFNTFESRVNVILNKARDFKGTLSSRNNLNEMIQSGSKGSRINMCQITSCVGQQNVVGKRISFRFKQRALPHFHRFDYSAIPCGFVLNSYLTGLQPYEFFFHAMGGREGIIDTAIKTSEIGYIQRKLIKTMEDAKVLFDYSVRNAYDSIFQFKYGDDGFDSKKLESVIIDRSNMKERFFIDMVVDLKYEIKDVHPDVYSCFKNDVELQKKLDDEYNYLINNNYTSYITPVNIQRLLKTKYTNNPKDKGNINDPLSPFVILEVLDSFASLYQDNPALVYYLRYSLAVKETIKMSKTTFECLIDDINNKIVSAHISFYENVGTLAAQSIGQPAIQMTLNTFHLAGVASTITTGLPRLAEIINLSHKLRTPSSIIYLKTNTIDAAKITKNNIEHLLIKDFCIESNILYDFKVNSTDIAEDYDLVTGYFEMPDDTIDYNSLGPLIFRFVLDRNVLVSRGVQIEMLVDEINFFFNKLNIKTHIIHSENYDEKLVIRIRFIKSNEPWEFYQNTMDLLLNHYISGIRKIKKAYLVQGNNEWYLQTDGINFIDTLSFENVDAERSMVNDFNEIYATLGIEAARESIFREIIQVIEGNGSYINYRHIGLLCDIMTSCGFLTGITRHGVSRAVKTGALNRSSFEQPVDVFLNTAINAEFNEAKGVSENVMSGQLVNCGTGAVEIYLDFDKLKEFNKDEVDDDSFEGALDQINAPDIDFISNSSAFYSEFTDMNTMKGFSPDYSANAPYSMTLQSTTAPYNSATFRADSSTFNPTSNNFNMVGSSRAAYYNPSIRSNLSPYQSRSVGDIMYGSGNRSTYENRSSYGSSPAAKFSGLSSNRYRPSSGSPGSSPYANNSSTAYSPGYLGYNPVIDYNNSYSPGHYSPGSYKKDSEDK